MTFAKRVASFWLPARSIKFSTTVEGESVMSLKRTSAKVCVFVLVALWCTPFSLGAINAHFLHGIGATNAGMGGVGTAVPTDVLSALRNNPALLTELEEGHHFAFSMLLLEGDNSVSSSVQTPFGTLSGTTENDAKPFVIPAFGFSRNVEDRPLAFGVGFLGTAGFAADFPQDSSNPLLLPEPQGLGAVSSNYELLQIPFAVAFELGEDTSLGVALLGGYASLQASPFGGAAPDCSSPTSCFLPRLNEDGAFGVGAQLGLFHRIGERFSLGFNYTSPIVFEDFVWNIVARNPNLPNFGTGREVRFNVDVPQTATFGLGYDQGRWKAGLDVRWINYEDTDGFESGFDPQTMAAVGLAWEDIVVFGLGAEYEFGQRKFLRLGYNLSESAITEATAFFNVASPAQFEDSVSVGVGFPLYEAMQLDLAYYHVFDTEESGPFQSPVGPIPGTRVTNQISADALLVTFSFHL